MAYNGNNPAVRRIMQEAKEMMQEKPTELAARPLTEDIFEWHFAIKGPPETFFEGGIYHGRILLPPEYPHKPPSFVFVTPNGRFEVGKKICLNISEHHPEHWQPSWSIRAALTALIAFLPTEGEGTIGSVRYPDGERKKLAVKSRSNPPTYTDTERQELAAELHQLLLNSKPGNVTEEAEDADSIQCERNGYVEQSDSATKGETESRSTNEETARKPSQAKLFWPLLVVLISLIFRRVVLSFTSESLN